jgi:hypothetical protein
MTTGSIALPEETLASVFIYSSRGRKFFNPDLSTFPELP